ncbi:MAG: DUF423 domain-containing protein [Ferruginibacter sp.]|nr:DUF423 domain-containing protein [Ferruginibacter sp.]
MQSSFLKTAALLGALAVAAGAFGAHALKQLISDKYLAVFETAVRYQFYHAFALLAVGIIFKEFPNNYLLWSGRLFCYGILIFSGSLYLLTLLEAMGQQGFKWLGAITPVGGLCLIAGWILLAIGIANKS